jgi:hypothetical protein
MAINRIFSTDSTKAIKANEFGYLNAIHYLAPHKSGDGKTNLCVNASPACIALCLGWFSGQASMVADLENGTNSVRESRKQKAARFMRDRANYLLDMVREIDRLLIAAPRKGMRLCVRLNGSSDIAWEGIRFTIERDKRGRAIRVVLGGAAPANMFDHYPMIAFVDYTKIAKRFDRALPANYHLTFSRSETNEAQALALLEAGRNVAVVFAGDKPLSWRGHIVVDGDKHDLRQLDPRAEAGCAGYVIGLSPKGSKAKKDSSGFVVR